MGAGCTLQCIHVSTTTPADILCSPFMSQDTFKNITRELIRTWPPLTTPRLNNQNAWGTISTNYANLSRNVLHGFEEIVSNRGTHQYGNLWHFCLRFGSVEFHQSDF